MGGLAVVWIAASACGDSSDSGSGAQPDAAVAPDARTTPPDGGGGSAGLVSNTPGATLVDVGNPATPDIELRSSNLLQEPSGGQVFQQWLGEIKNAGSSPLCLVELHVGFRTAAGIQLASFDTFADADAYMIGGLSLPIPCIPPGQIGSLYSNAFVPAAIQLAGVTRIEVGFSSSPAVGAAPAPHAPAVASREGPVFGTESGVIGTLTGVGGAIYNIGYTAYPRDASGLVVARLFATDLDTLAPGAVFPFTTIGTDTPFTLYREYTDFIDGPKPNGPVVTAAPATAVAAIAARRRALRQELRDRAATAARGR